MACFSPSWIAVARAFTLISSGSTLQVFGTTDDMELQLGILDNASAAVFSLPGLYFMVKLYCASCMAQRCSVAPNFALVCR